MCYWMELHKPRILNRPKKVSWIEDLPCGGSFAPLPFEQPMCLHQTQVFSMPFPTKVLSRTPLTVLFSEHFWGSCNEIFCHLFPRTTGLFSTPFIASQSSQGLGWPASCASKPVFFIGEMKLLRVVLSVFPETKQWYLLAGYLDYDWIWYHLSMFLPRRCIFTTYTILYNRSKT